MGTKQMTAQRASIRRALGKGPGRQANTNPSVPCLSHANTRNKTIHIAGPESSNLSISPILSVPAAAYLRVSHEVQMPSLSGQASRIQAYAAQRGFAVVKTYVDAGRSGLVLRRRSGLLQLLKDVLSGAAVYKAILVDDMSRWGRFQDSDESAHYEFMCKQAGVPVHYCSEGFCNDNSMASGIVKSLQRVIVGEYSRELSDKCFRGLQHVITLGYRAGGVPGFGFRRVGISGDQSRYPLRSGQRKALAMDRVILVRGPQREVECVQRIFQMKLAGGRTLASIARELNETGAPHPGKRPWDSTSVWRVLVNPKYKGTLVWNKTTRRLQSRCRRNSSASWIIRDGAVPAIVDHQTFDRVQRIIQKEKRRWTCQELLEKLTALKANKGYLSLKLIQTTKGMPSTATLHRRLGPLEKIYPKLGYSCPREFFGRSSRRSLTQIARDRVIKKIMALLPGLASVVHLPRKRRPLIRLSNGQLLSILVCNKRRVKGQGLVWIAYPAVAERDFTTLLCFVDEGKPNPRRYYLVPQLPRRRSRIFPSVSSKLLKTGVRLNNLSDLCEFVKPLKKTTREET